MFFAAQPTMEEVTQNMNYPRQLHRHGRAPCNKQARVAPQGYHPIKALTFALAQR